MAQPNKTIIKFIILACLVVAYPCYGKDLILNNTPAKVCFSPNAGCTDSIVKEIAQAKESVLVLAYSFTSAPIGRALIDAKKRGIDVQVVIDKGKNNERYNAVTFFRNQGIPVYVDGYEKMQHNKVIVIDKSTVITGSFNFTKAAESSNAENVLIIKSRDLSKLYVDNWLYHKNHSK